MTNQNTNAKQMLNTKVKGVRIKKHGDDCGPQMTQHYESPSALQKFTLPDEMKETVKCTEKQGQHYQACVLFCVESDRITQNRRGEGRRGAKMQ